MQPHRNASRLDLVRRATRASAPLLAALAAGRLVAQQQLFAVAGEARGDRAAFVIALGDMNGDGTADFAVGAPSAETNGVTTGAVDVRSGRDGALIRTLGGDVAGFGRALADVGDVDHDGVDDLAVGSPLAVDPTTSKATGAVWLFSGATGAVRFTKYGSNANFGVALCGIADADSDGVRDIAVGSPAETTQNSRVTILSGATGATIRQLQVKNTRGFGIALCDAGDANSDGAGDFLISDYLATNAQGDVTAGRTYLYSGKTLTTLRTYDGEDTGDEFGAACAWIGDVDGDGIRDHLIAAARAPSAGKSLGAAYVFSGVNGSPLGKLQDAGLDAYFATSVAGAGDVNGDGKADLLIGFTGGDGRDAFVNGARLYSGNGFAPLYRFEGAADDNATVSVAALGDSDGDGRADVLVGALGRYRPQLGDYDGMVRAYGGAALYLAVDPRSPHAGDTLTLATAQGLTGNAVLTALVEVDGIPFFLALGGVGAFDSHGGYALAGDVPRGLVGHSVAFRSLALDGAGQIVSTATETITFQ